MKYITIYLTIFTFILAGCSKQESTKAQKKDIIDAVFASGSVSFSEEYIVTANTEGFILQATIKEGDAVAQNALLFQLSNDVQNLQATNAQTNYQEAVNNADLNSPKIQLLNAQITQARQVMELDRKNMERYEAEINLPKIQQISQQLEQAKQTLELDKKNFERYEALVKTNAISKLEYDKIKLQYENSQKNVAILEKNLAEKQALTSLDYDKIKLQYENSKSNVAVLEKSLADLKNTLSQNVKNTKNQVEIQRQYTGDYAINAAMSGTVLTVFKELGELARKGEALAKIGSGKLLTKLFVAEEDINRIEVGQKVVLSLNTEKEKSYEATVLKIYPSFNEKEQAFEIEVELKEPIAKLRAGTQVQANIVIGEKKNATILLRKYLLKGDKVLTEKGEVPVKVGINSGEWVEITEGLDTNIVVLSEKK